MDDLLRPDLWDLIRPVLRPAQTAAENYLAANGYVEKFDARTYHESSAGWPLVTSERFFADGPPKWSSLFSLEPGKFSKILIADIPEFATALDGVLNLSRKDEGFRRAFSPLLWDDPKRQDWDTSITFLGLVGEILGRADALNLQSDEELLNLYRQVERGRFAEVLDGDVMVPLVLTGFDASEPVHLVDDYWLEPITEEVHRARALGVHDDVSQHIAAAATHAVVRRGARLINPHGSQGDSLGRFDVSDVVALTRHVMEAIHIATEQKAGYAQVLIRGESWVSWRGWHADLPHVYRAATVVGYPLSFDGGWNRPMKRISNTELDEVRLLVQSLGTSPKNVQLAARRCLRTTFRGDVEDEILDATIGIEALLSGEKDELTHRMSLRAAVALSDTFRSDAVYALMKQVYNQRSQIVHGTTPKNSLVRFEGTEFAANHMGVYLLRYLLKSRLLADEGWTPSSLDALIIERLGVPSDSALEGADDSSADSQSNEGGSAG